MTALFLFLFNRGITASFLILAVIVLRFLFRKLPKNPQLLLWALVALRLAIPFSLESSLSLMPKTEAVSILTGSTVISPRNLSEMPVPTATVPAPAVAPQPSFSQKVLPAASQASAAQAPFTGPNGTENGLLVVCTLLWLLGAAGMLTYCLAAYLRLRKKLSVSLRLDGNVYLCDGIPAPFLLGLFRPRIYLPSGLNPEARTYVLAHEKAHLRHGDAWWKMLGFLLLSVYWFHPLVWCGYWLFCQDLEMACDERAVKGMDHCQRKSYACTLLLCAAPKGTFPICPVAFSQSGIKARIANILQTKNTKLWICLLAVMLAVIFVCCFATSPKSEDKTFSNQSGLSSMGAEEQDPSEAQKAADFLRRYLDACRQESFSNYAQFLYFPNEGIYARQKEAYAPSTDICTIDSQQRINDKLWAFSVSCDGLSEPIYLFVGKLDGEYKVIQNVYDIPDSLRENLREADFQSDVFMHESSELAQIQYELRFFAVPKSVACFHMEAIPEGTHQGSFFDLLWSTDAWTIAAEDTPAPGPEEIDVGCRITGYDGRVLVIRSGRDGFDLYSRDGTHAMRVLGFSGEEILGFIQNWARNWDATANTCLNALGTLILDQDSNQISYPGQVGGFVNAGGWGRVALAIAVVQAVPDPESTLVYAPIPGSWDSGSYPLQKDVLDGLTVQDHLYRMLLFNQYDSAYALAYSVFGGEAAAVEQMNAVTMEVCQREPFRGLYNQDTGTLPIEGLAKLISTMLEKPLLNKIWHAASYTVPSTQELVYSANALLPGTPLVLSHISQDSRVTGGLAARSGDYADLAVTAEYGGRRVLCVLTGALRVSHPYMDNPSSYDVVDYWGNYEEMEKLLNIAFG